MSARQITLTMGRRAVARGGGVAMRVLAVDHAAERACCAGIEGIATRVHTALVAPVARGDVLFVHAGVALLRLDDEWAL